LATPDEEEPVRPRLALEFEVRCSEYFWKTALMLRSLNVPVGDEMRCCTDA